MKRLLLLLLIPLLLIACQTEEVQEIQTEDSPQPVAFETYILHTLDQPHVDLPCPNKSIESYVIIKMGEIVNGNMTIIEHNECFKQTRICSGMFDVSERNNNNCWKLECQVESPNRIDNTGVITIEYKDCDIVKVRDIQNTINTSKELSWEILPY